METDETASDQPINVKPLQIQPVPTSGGRDLAKDLVWQRDPDCSRDPLASNNALVSHGVPVAYSSTVTQGLQPSTEYQYQGQHQGYPTSSGDHISGSMVQTFQIPQRQNVVTYMPVTNPVIMDTDGNRIQNPMHQQGAYPVTQNMVPVQFPSTGNSGNIQYINMPPPSSTDQQSQQNFNYPRLVPFNPQTMTLPKSQANTHLTNPQVSPKPRALNVTMANQVAQKHLISTMSSAGTQVSSPVLVSPSIMSPIVASPGTESVKSPTYVFMCNKCSYVTPHRSSFKTHYSSHMQYKPFQCAYCDHATIMKQPMQKHIKLKHAIEDAEGFTYESDLKMEKIIDFHCNQCRSTMSVDEAKSFLAKYESHEKLKPGPSKRKGHKDGEDDETITPSKRKKTFSWSDHDDNEQNSKQETTTQNTNTPQRNKHAVSPRKLTHWKQDVSFNSETGMESMKKGPSKKRFPGRPKKFLGFGKTNKFSSPTPTLKNGMGCPFCEFKSGSRKGLKRHCEWRHPANKMKCTKCRFSTYFSDEMNNHIEQNQCEIDNTNIILKPERGKSPEKTVGRPRKSISSDQTNKRKATVVQEGLSEENSDESSDDTQLNCPHCNFVSHPLALKRHLFFYHKECDWRCKNCGFISSSKKEVVRHSNKAHPDLQLNIVQTFADISSLLPDTASEKEKSTPPDKDIDENGMDKHRMIDRDFIKTSKKRLVLGKKRVSKIDNNGQLGIEEKVQVAKVAGTEKKRGRKKEGKANDQNSYVVRPKKLRIAKIGFSCVYCTYAAPLRHQLRLHCYEKHTKHPACLMEFVNSKMVEEEQSCFQRDMTEDQTSPDRLEMTATIVTNMNENKMDPPELEPETTSAHQSEKDTKSTDDMKGQAEESTMETESSYNQSVSENSETSHKGKDLKRNKKLSGVDSDIIERSSTRQLASNTNQCIQGEVNQNEDVLSCMETILDKIGHREVIQPTSNNKTGAFESSALNYVLPDNSNKNGHKFSNPFSTLIVQLNSTQIKVKDAFEGTLDDVDIYLEKFGVRTLNMDSLTPRQFAVFMKKFGSHLQPL